MCRGQILRFQSRQTDRRTRHPLHLPVQRGRQIRSPSRQEDYLRPQAVYGAWREAKLRDLHCEHLEGREGTPRTLSLQSSGLLGLEFRLCRSGDTPSQSGENSRQSSPRRCCLDPMGLAPHSRKGAWGFFVSNFLRCYFRILFITLNSKVPFEFLDVWCNFSPHLRKVRGGFP